MIKAQMMRSSSSTASPTPKLNAHYSAHKTVVVYSVSHVSTFRCVVYRTQPSDQWTGG